MPPNRSPMLRSEFIVAMAPSRAEAVALRSCSCLAALGSTAWHRTVADDRPVEDDRPFVPGGAWNIAHNVSSQGGALQAACNSHLPYASSGHMGPALPARTVWRAASAASSKLDTSRIYSSFNREL